LFTEAKACTACLACIDATLLKQHNLSLGTMASSPQMGVWFRCTDCLTTGAGRGKQRGPWIL